MLRVPQALKDCVCFVCLRQRGVWKSGGTGLIVGFRAEHLERGMYHAHVVTAGHLIEDAKRGRMELALRLNTKSGEVTFLTTSKHSWLRPDDVSSDLAVLYADIPDEVQCSTFPVENFAGDDTIRKYIGMGTEVFALGLFPGRKGERRNLPILRAGIISCMPEEPLYGSKKNEYYNAYLVELRSLGGLSGSPVFAFYERGQMFPPPVDFSPYVHGVILVGFIRGHWDTKAQRRDAFYPDIEQVNMGIAALTPVQELIPVLEGEKLASKRREEEQKLLEQRDLTLDRRKCPNLTKTDPERGSQNVGRGVAENPKTNP